MMANSAINHFFFTLPRSCGIYRKIIVCSAVAPTTTSTDRISSAKLASANSNLVEESSVRRSAGNYQHPNWDFKHVQSLKNEYTVYAEEYRKRSEVLKEYVKMMLEEEVELLNQLELIDTLQRLGLSYHFEEKIQAILCGICNRNGIDDMPKQQDLYARALEFRLLRQHGFQVSQGIFDSFKNENGAFNICLSEDSKGMLYLYEASYFQTENDETNLELAREFTIKYLRKKLDEDGFDQTLAALVQHSLELPLHWRIMRLEARWFVDVYEKSPEMNPVLLELAKLDFNIVQETHQNELKYVSRWWNSTHLGEELKFARDILVENFFWNVGIISNPEQEYCRKMVTKVAVLITIIDDVYDTYGTLDELELFTSAVESWDTNSIDQLPGYMKICFLALYNTINQMAYDALKEQGVNIIPYLRKSWADLCKAYLQEARWYFNGHIPKLEEYLNNAWISVSAPLVLVHVYFCITNPIKQEDLECLHNYHNIIRSSAMIVRLTNDLGASPLAEKLKSGDIPKSIECYMKENHATEEEAREYIRFLISEAWKEMNIAKLTDSPFSPKFKEIAMNFARTAQCMYQHGDGHGFQNSETPNHIAALLFEPFCTLSYR